MTLNYIVCAVFIVIINITDIKSYKIKNKIVLPAVIVGLILGAVNGAFLDNVYGMLIPLVLFPLYVLRMLGAGDIKALCVVGAILGFKLSVFTMAFTFICGGVIALVFLLFSKNFTARVKYLFGYIKLCLVTKRVQKYDFGGGEKSYFRFSYAITAGTLAAIIANLYG